jgi:hypothetical protein
VVDALSSKVTQPRLALPGAMFLRQLDWPPPEKFICNFPGFILIIQKWSYTPFQSAVVVDTHPDNLALFVRS